MNVNAGILRRIARLAHDRIGTPGDRETQVDIDGIVAVVFAAASLEAFINELATFAATAPASDPPPVRAFAELLRMAEESRGTTALKFALAGQAFMGAPYDRSAEPFQSLDLLFSLRDAIARKVPDTFGEVTA